jgi:arylsulfatase A-like enzyme
MVTSPLGPRARLAALAVISVVILLAGLVAGPVAASHSQAPPDPRPNVVMIMVDDLPPLDGRLYAVLPNIRHTFVDHGVDFTNFEGETPLCCPGRVGFLTGQHTFHHGVTVNDATLFDPAMSLATQLHGVGYQTTLAGKYLNHYGPLAGTVPPGWDQFSTKTSINDYYG